MKKVAFLVLILVGSLTLSALNVVGRLGGTVQAATPPPEAWEQYYRLPPGPPGTGFDWKAYSVVQTFDGGYMLGGTNYSYPGLPSGHHALLVKTDSSGNMQWSKSYPGLGSGVLDDDEVRCVVQTSDGGYAFAGYTVSSNGYAWLVKTDSAGNQVWSQTYTAPGITNYAYAYSVVQTSDGGYGLAGTMLWKTDSAGNLQWNTTLGGVAYSIVRTSDGGYALAGDYIWKTDSTGWIQWSRSLPHFSDTFWALEAYSIVQTSDGGYAYAGDGGLPFSFGHYLAKTDSWGILQWNITQPSDGIHVSVFNSVVQTSDGGYAVAGSGTWLGHGKMDVDVLKTNSSGGVEWEGYYGSAEYDEGYCVIETSDGGLAIAGYWYISFMYLIKLSAFLPPPPPILINIKTWYWTGLTVIKSVAVADVDGDGKTEIITGGYYAGHVDAQLCVWDSASLALKNVKYWYWTSGTYINSVAVGDVDGDGKVEIVTGGSYYDGTRWVAQLCVWNGASLALKNVKYWYWTGGTYINSVAVGDVDGDGKVEIVTGGQYYDGTRLVAQLCVWNGATLDLKKVKTWYWTSNTYLNSVAIGDEDADTKNEIVTGGSYLDGSRYEAQLCVWDGATLDLKNVKTWYWTGTTSIGSVAISDVDADGKNEIVTGGLFNDGTRGVAQLCVWNGATLGLKGVQTWYWTNNTEIISVAVGDVDADGKTEIVTGGYYNDNTRDVAQLCVWDGATLAFKKVKTWYWTGTTRINSVAVASEIVTGGFYNDGTRDVAQLCVWA